MFVNTALIHVCLIMIIVYYFYLVVRMSTLIWNLKVIQFSQWFVKAKWLQATRKINAVIKIKCHASHMAKGVATAEPWGVGGGWWWAYSGGECF